MKIAGTILIAALSGILPGQIAGDTQGNTVDPKWVKLRSANFELFTSAGERAGRRTIQQFERTRDFFRQAMQREVSNSMPVRIVLFRSKKEYLPYRPGEATAAYYLSGPDADLIVLVAGNESSQAIHEYVHLLVRHSGLRLPVWMNEGLADLYSNRYILLNSNGLEVIQRRLGTILGPSCTQGSPTAASLAPIRCKCFVRSSSPHR